MRKMSCLIRTRCLLVQHSCPSVEIPYFKINHAVRCGVPRRKQFFSTVCFSCEQPGKELLVVVGGGAAGIFGAIQAKTVAPDLNVVVIEKGKPLSKVKISGGGRCNVTNGHFVDSTIFAEHYPRGYRELRGSFFNFHGASDTMSWFSDRGVMLKTEDDGRVFPVSDSSSSVIECLLSEAKEKGVTLHTGRSVTSAAVASGGKFQLKIEKRTWSEIDLVEADYLLVATGSSNQGYSLATQFGHTIEDPVPSLFTFKIKDSNLTELSGIAFSKVKAKLKLGAGRKSMPQLTQTGPMLVTHWGLSGPVILRLSAWGARELFSLGYKGTLVVDFVPDINIEEVKSILLRLKNISAKKKVVNSNPSEFGIVNRFWRYILARQGLGEDLLWASISKDSLFSVAALLKQCSFDLTGKGQFKDEFVTAGGVPLSEVLLTLSISLSTMESQMQKHLFFAGEVLNVDGITGGFNFQNAWSGGYIAGTTIGNLAHK